MKRLLSKLINIIIIIFLIFYCLIWSLSSIIIKEVINTNALPAGFSLTPESNIRYNPFTSHLTINNLAIKPRKQKATLKLNSLEAELHLHQLLFDTLYISKFTLDGLYIPVAIEGSNITIAGITSNITKENTTDNDVLSDDKKPFALNILVPKVKLTNIVFDIKHLDTSHHLVLDTLLLDNILFSQDRQNIHLNLKSKINQAPLDIDIHTELFQQLGIVKVEVSLDNFALDYVQPFMPEMITELNAQVNYSSKFHIALSKQNTQIDFKHFLLTINKLHAKQNGLSIDVANQDIQSNDIAVTLLPNNTANIAAKLNATLKNISVGSLSNNSQLAVIEDVDIKNISLLFVDNIPSITVENVDVNNSVFSQFNDKRAPALASFKRFSMNRIDYEHKVNKLSVENMTLAEVEANILLDKNKQLSTLTTLNSNIASSSKVDATVTNIEVKTEADKLVKAENKPKKETDTEPEIAFSLGGFSLVEGANITFNDLSVSPHYKRNFHINVLSLSAIDSTKPNLETLLNLQGKSDKYEHFDVNGRGLLFAVEPKYHVDAVIKELSLPSVSSYIKDALTFEIESGQLDLIVKAGLKGKEIDGEINVLLRGIEFSAADDHEINTVADQTSIPFNIALGMLKDSDGNVELVLPLSGDTSSPSFGLSGLLTLLVKQATISAAKEYLIATFIPYSSVLKVAMAAGEFALKLRVNDLNYSPQQITLNAEQIEFSRQMSVMLAQRSDINVKLCAIAIPADIALLDAKAALLEENVQRLQAISSQRVDVFKSTMVEKFGVSSAKLLRCTSQVDTTKGAKSRIEFII